MILWNRAYTTQAAPSPSSRGLGLHSFKVATRVRIPLGTPTTFNLPNYSPISMVWRALAAPVASHLRELTPATGGAGPHSTATAFPAPGPANASSAADVVFAVCSCTVAMLSWGRGDGFTGGGLSQSKWSSGHGRKQRAKNAENKRGAWALTGLGHGLINWCGDVRFTPESGHICQLPQRSAFDPKRTLAGLRRRYVCRILDTR